MTVWLDIAHNSDCRLPFKIFWLIVALGYGFSIMYSRLFLGVHSIDQVVYGASLGLWCTYTMQYCIREHLEREAILLLEGRVTEFTKRFWYCWAYFAVVELGQVIEFVTLNHLIENNGDNLPVWTVNIEDAGCGHSLKNPF